MARVKQALAAAPDGLGPKVGGRGNMMAIDALLGMLLLALVLLPQAWVRSVFTRHRAARSDFPGSPEHDLPAARQIFQAAAFANVAAALCCGLPRSGRM
jgi:hypothetical protein